MKKNNLLEFYTDVLNTLKVQINDDGGLYIKTVGSKGKLPFTLNAIPMYLPTKENIKTALEPDEHNKLQLVKELFNPLDESTNRGDNKSLLRLKLHMDKLLNHAFSVVGEVLFSILNDKDIEINDMYLLEVISALNEKKTAGRKTMVDEGTVKAFITIYKNRIAKVNKLFLHTFLKNGGKIDGVSYNRISVLSFPILEELMSLDKDKTIEGVKLRLKDIDAIEVLHTAIFNTDVNTLLKGLQFPSKDKHSPAFATLVTMYTNVAKSINNIIDGLISLNIDNDFLEDTKLNMFPFSLDDLEDILKNVQPALKEVPTDIAIKDTNKVYNQNVATSNMNNIVLANNDKQITSKLYNNNNSSENSIFNNNVQESEPSALDIILNASNQNTIFNDQQTGVFNNNANVFNNQQTSMFNTPAVNIVNSPW
jgi:hypothetical protein